MLEFLNLLRFLLFHVSLLLTSLACVVVMEHDNYLGRSVNSSVFGINVFKVLFREDATVDDLIDVIEGNRKYMKCIYVYNKIDVIGIDDVDRLARQPNSIVISCNLKVFAHFQNVHLN